MNAVVALPVLIPFLAGALSLVFYKSHAAQRWLGVIGTGSLLIAAILLFYITRTDGIQVLALGSWAAPFGIVLVADLLGATMTLLTAILGFAVAIYSLASISKAHTTFGHYPLLQLLLAGVCGAFLTGDIFNLYVWVEVLLVASFGLLILGGQRAQMEGAVKYVALNLLSSTLLLVAVSLTYGVTGTLNMADLVGKLAAVENQGLVTVIAMLFLVAFGIKSAAFPLFFWLPASYHTPPMAVSALFAGLLTKVGVYALYRFFSLLFSHDVGYTHDILLVMAGFTMISGVLGAVWHNDIRRILSFLIISAIGYMIMALALFTPTSLAGGVFYLIHDIIVKANLFLLAGIIFFLCGSFRLHEIGGLWRDKPWLAIVFLVPALSLAGAPPLSGFFGKYLIVLAGVQSESWIMVGLALLTGLLTFYCVARIWSAAFWQAVADDFTAQARASAARLSTRSFTLMMVPVVILALLTLLIGLAADPVYRLTEAIAGQMLDPQMYVEAVLGDSPGAK
ncbi:MAG: Na+/H+ antiporter subunit D [Gammaproteobacteria bacterium]